MGVTWLIVQRKQTQNVYPSKYTVNRRTFFSFARLIGLDSSLLLEFLLNNHARSTYLNRQNQRLIKLTSLFKGFRCLAKIDHTTELSMLSQACTKRFRKDTIGLSYSMAADVASVYSMSDTIRRIGYIASFVKRGLLRSILTQYIQPRKNRHYSIG